jgi:hypothetical protein
MHSHHFALFGDIVDLIGRGDEFGSGKSPFVQDMVVVFCYGGEEDHPPDLHHMQKMQCWHIL